MHPLIIIGLIILGWLLGILVNYLGDVLPVTRRFSQVECSVCQKPINVFDYLLLKQCSECSKRRTTRAWIIQLIYLSVTIFFGLSPTGELGFIASLVVLVYFGVVVLIDIEHRLIMHPVSMVGGIICFGIGFWQHGLLQTVLGGAAGLAIMLGVYFLGILFARWLARRRKMETDEEGLGFGDVALSCVLGFLLGWPGIGAGLIIAVLLGGAVSLVVMVIALVTKKFHAFMAIPYGPFLITAAVVLLFWPGM